MVHTIKNKINGVMKKAEDKTRTNLERNRKIIERLQLESLVIYRRNNSRMSEERIPKPLFWEQGQLRKRSREYNLDRKYNSL